MSIIESVRNGRRRIQGYKVSDPLCAKMVKHWMLYIGNNWINLYLCKRKIIYEYESYKKGFSNYLYGYYAEQ